MLSKNLENSTSYDIIYKIWKKARVYYTLSISRGGGQAPGPPPGGQAPGPPPPWIRHWGCNAREKCCSMHAYNIVASFEVTTKAIKQVRLRLDSNQGR